LGNILFGPGGIPLSTAGKTNENGVLRCAELGLDCMELEFVYGANISSEQAELTRKAASSTGIKLSVHAPYYINLNSKDSKKEAASVSRILASTRKGSAAGADQVVFHAAFYLDSHPDAVFSRVKNHLAEIRRILNDESMSHVILRPELTGKPSHFGDLDELIRLSLEVEGVLPCVDFSHYYARYAGRYNSYDDFMLVLETIEKRLGETALANMHIHLSGIEYTPKGERKHLEVQESSFNFGGVLKALYKSGASGRVICESPNVETDAVLFKKSYSLLAKQHVKPTRQHKKNL